MATIHLEESDGIEAEHVEGVGQGTPLEPDDTDPIEADDADEGEDAEDTEEQLAEDVTDEVRHNNVLQLLPVHAAPIVGGKSKGGTKLEVKRGRGRPRKVERMATTSDLEYHALMSAEKARFIAQDPVVIAASNNRVQALAILALIRVEIAKEAAAIQFQRMESEKFGKDTSQTSTRRIDALGKIANIELEMKKLGPTTIDPHSEEFQKIFALWLELLKGIMTELFTAQQIDLFFNRLDSALEGWEERVQNVGK